MKKTSKKLWGLVFALAFVLTMLPLSAFAAEYEIWVGETQITDDNKGDVLGDGTVYYNSDEGVLTLNGATIDSTEWYGINSATDLTIELQGENEINLQDVSEERYGIIAWGQSSNANTNMYHDLIFKGDGNLDIKTGDSAGKIVTGIRANDFTVAFTGILNVNNFKYGIDASSIILDAEAILHVGGASKAITVAPTINIPVPSIVAGVTSSFRYKIEKIEPAEIGKLAEDNRGYKTIAITPKDKLAKELEVTILPTEGVTVMVKKIGDPEFKEALNDLTEDDLIEVKVEVQDSNKELDALLLDDVEENEVEGEKKVEGNTFVMWSGNIELKAVLKDKSTSSSTGGGGASGRASVRPDSATATEKPKETATTTTPIDKAKDTTTATTSNNEVRLMIASTKMEKGNDSVVMDTAPFIKNGRTMVPLRYIGEVLGLKVNWDAKTKTVTLSNESQEIVVPTNTLSMKANGKTLQSDVLPVLQGGRVYLSISNIGKALGLEQGKEIRWDAEAKTVIISMESN